MKIDFSSRSTRINKKQLKSIDPRRILTAVLRLKKELYDKPYDPQKFIDSLCQVYLEIIEKDQLPLGRPVPMQTFYLAYVIFPAEQGVFSKYGQGEIQRIQCGSVLRGSVAVLSGRHRRAPQRDMSFNSRRDETKPCGFWIPRENYAR